MTFSVHFSHKSLQKVQENEEENMTKREQRVRKVIIRRSRRRR
jgi:hypothetical protein